MKVDDHVVCAFITVDPERDAPDVMQKYLKGEFFHAQAQHTCINRKHSVIVITCMVSLVTIMTLY